MAVLFFIILGAIIGSFLAALTWRWPHGMSIFDGRSVCPKCKHQIRAIDNVPIFSFLMLGGKCRNCDKKISKRYFIIECSSALMFGATYLLFGRISSNLVWLSDFSPLIALSVLLTVE